MKSRFTIDMKFDHPTFTSTEINTANPKTMIDSTTQKTPIRVVESSTKRRRRKTREKMKLNSPIFASEVSISMSPAAEFRSRQGLQTTNSHHRHYSPQKISSLITQKKRHKNQKKTPYSEPFKTGFPNFKRKSSIQQTKTRTRERERERLGIVRSVNCDRGILHRSQFKLQMRAEHERERAREREDMIKAESGREKGGFFAPSAC